MNTDEYRETLACEVGGLLRKKGKTLLVLSTCRNFVFLRSIYLNEFYIYDRNNYSAIMNDCIMPVMFSNYILASSCYESRVKSISDTPCWL